MACIPVKGAGPRTTESRMEPRPSSNNTGGQIRCVEIDQPVVFNKYSNTDRPCN